MITWLRQLFCPHREKTIVVLATALTAELTAEKCSRCSKLKNIRWEL